MSAPLTLGETFVPAEVWLARYLSPLAAVTPWQRVIASQMWTAGAPKPYRAVRRITGPRTVYSDEPVMRVHTFADTYSAAAFEAGRTDDIVLVLVDYPGWGTTMPDGRIVQCDWAEIVEAAHEEPYAASSVVTRFVSEYRFGLSSAPSLPG